MNRVAHVKHSRIIGIVLLLTVCISCREKDEPQQKPASGNCDLVSFVLEKGRNSLSHDIEFTLDTENRTLKGMYLDWIDGDSPDRLIPRFKITGKEVRVNGKKIESDRSGISFADPVTLVVFAENGNEKAYTVDLNCPQINTELPVIRLQPEKEITSKTEYVPARATLYSPHTREGWWRPADGVIGVRGRGNSTWILPKKPYRLKFPEKVSPVGLDHAREKSWVLLAHDMDKSLIRNHLAFTLSHILFDPAEHYHHEKAVLFTPASQFINVYMNNQYHGLYQLSDQMERGDGRIDVQKLTAAEGADPAKITGGHILETDVHGARAPERFNSARKRIQINHKYPDAEDYHPAQYAYIENFIQDAEDALYGEDFTDPEKGWRKYFDEKTLIDFVIIKELAADMDGFTSTYMYKRRDCDKLFFGPIWDVDKGWDNERRGAWDYLDKLMIHSGFQMPGAPRGADWFNRLWEDPDFRMKVRARWESKRAALLDTIDRELDLQPVRMHKAIEANYTVWPFYYQASTEAKMPEKTYEAEIARIRRLTYARANLLDRLFAQ